MLKSAAGQQMLPTEVVIADDGSTATTSELIERMRTGFPCPIKHVWHEDTGYQAAQIRNKAVAAASGEYLIFLDSDCVLRPDFVRRHVALSRPGHFVAGNRILLSESFTRQVLEQQIDISTRSAFSFSREQVNRRWSMLRLPIGPFRNLNPDSWRDVKTCNMSVYRSSFERINGFEEQFEGWGYEDSEMVVRLLNAGERRISGRFATTVLHLWHNTNKSHQEEGNWQRLQETISSGSKTAALGVSQY